MQGYLECVSIIYGGIILLLLFLILWLISFAAVSTINNAGLTDEEKAETETYLYQEGLWLVLHHYLSVEVFIFIFNILYIKQINYLFRCFCMVMSFLLRTFVNILRSFFQLRRQV